MRVVKPLTINDATFTSSTIPEPDSSVGEIVWAAATFTLGTRRINTTTHRVYEVVADPNTADDPVDGVDANPPTWVNVAATNKFAMVDTINSTQSLETTQLITEFTMDVVANSIAGFAIEEATAINITMTDPIVGIVFDRDIDMVDNSEVIDWYYYFFSPIVQKTEFVILDMPAFPAATIKMTVDGGDIKFGNVVIGNQIPLGVANHGTSVQLLDFSRKETDEFGNTVVIPGRTSKLVDYDVTVATDKVGFVFNTLAKLTTIPAVWVGTDEVDDATLVFGYYRHFQDNITTPTITDATIQIEGLT